MKVRHIWVIPCVFFFIISIVSISGQGANVTYFKGNYKEMFIEAESNLLYEDYFEAYYLYNLIYQYFPNNYNIAYKIGLCMLNITGLKDNAITYLETASKNWANITKDNSLKETRAPADVFYYLGNAYRINNDLDKAIESYKTFIEKADVNIYDVDIAKAEITACNAAKELMANPIQIKPVNMGKQINDDNPNIYPVVSGNDSVLVFVSQLKFYDAVLFSKRKSNGEWGAPVNIIPQLGVDNKCYPTSLSFDGRVLYLYRNQDFGGDIYVSYYIDERWTPITKLNKNINTKYWESHACISKDGHTLYFTSNRPGGYGGLDIYVTKKNAKGDWGIPENLGPKINTPLNEQSPFITMDNEKLFFSSQGHTNMGGYDIFYAARNGNEWSDPVNIGYPINSTDDDIFFYPAYNGTAAYFSMILPQGFGKQDIYFIEIPLR